jgi:hypothetical protein
VARKKKSKSNRKKPSSAASDGPATPDSDGDEKEAQKKTQKKATSSKKRTPKKKRSRKKAEKRAEAAPPPPPSPPEEGPAEEPATNLDLDADEADLDDLVSQVAVLDTTDAPAEDAEVIDLDEPEADASAIVDLDEVFDIESGGSDELDALIAQTVAGADLEDLGDELPVETLDDDPPVVVIDEVPEEEVAAPPPPEPGVTPEPATALRTAGSPAGPAPQPSSEADLEDAIDLGPVSSPEVRDRLLAQALAHSEMQDARYRVPFSNARSVGRWKGAVAAVLVLIAAVSAVAPPGWVRPEPPAQVTASGHARSIRLALLLQAQQVDAYRVRLQQLPRSLDDLSARLPGVRFVRSGNRSYQLIGYERDGNAIIYDSSNPAVEFERLIPSWTPVVSR